MGRMFDSVIGRGAGGRGAGGRARFTVGLIYKTVSVADAQSRGLSAIGSIRRRITCIGLPQQVQRKAGRGLSGVGGHGAVLRTRCTTAIRRL